MQGTEAVSTPEDHATVIEPDLAGLGRLFGEASRAAMLLALMDGRAQTAKELAYRARIAAATASEHLRMLEAAGLLARERQGRNCYFRIADARVAAFIEAASAVAVDLPVLPLWTGPADPRTRNARCCWDHLAGRLGVRLTERLVVAGDIIRQGDTFVVADKPRLLPMLLDTELPAPSSGKVCLDWSERRPHIGGRLGQAVFQSLVDRHWVVRAAAGRAVDVTPVGRSELGRLVGPLGF